MNKSISCKRKFREQNKASGDGCLGRKQGTLYFRNHGMLEFVGYPDFIIQIKFRKFYFNFPQLFILEWLGCAWYCARDQADRRDEPVCLSRTTEKKTCTWVRAIQITRCPWKTSGYQWLCAHGAVSTLGQLWRVLCLPSRHYKVKIRLMPVL